MDDSAQAAGLKQKLENYQPSAATIALVKDTPILLLVGVSGAGKDSIKHKLLSTGRYHHIVSHTTRSPRENHGVLEQDGREYHFIDPAEAAQMLDGGEFVEAKIYSGNVYGTSVAEIQKAHDHHKIALTDMEVQGVAEYESISANVRALFILPPSFEVWQQRLEQRYDGDANPDDIKRRMQTAKHELEEALHKDYFRFVINDDLDAAVEVTDQIAHGAPVGKESEAAQSLARQLLSRLGN